MKSEDKSLKGNFGFSLTRKLKLFLALAVNYEKETKERFRPKDVGLTSNVKKKPLKKSHNSYTIWDYVFPAQYKFSLEGFDSEELENYLKGESNPQKT